jgi:hypothetical protein
LVPQEVTAPSTHHLRLAGDRSAIDEMLARLRDGSLGLRVTQHQRYSANSAAINIATRDKDTLETIADAAARLAVHIDIHALD